MQFQGARGSVRLMPLGLFGAIRPTGAPRSCGTADHGWSHDVGWSIERPISNGGMERTVGAMLGAVLAAVATAQAHQVATGFSANRMRKNASAVAPLGGCGSPSVLLALCGRSPPFQQVVALSPTFVPVDLVGGRVLLPGQKEVL
jgi:hypothetical protein